LEFLNLFNSFQFMSLSLYTFPFAAMGSHSNEVRLFAGDAAQAYGLAQLAIAEVQRIESKYSRYQPDSLLSQINQYAGTRWVDCDEETMALIRFGDALFKASEAKFDLTSGVLRRVWNFGDTRLPNDVLLQSCLSDIGWGMLEFDEHRVRFSKQSLELDFGGIGKEYAADRAGALLVNAGVSHGFVNLAGDLSVIGPQPNGRAWSIAVPHPRDTSSTLASIPITAGGMATSGDYERFFELSGRRYCHILNPLTGYPVQHWQSVTVLAPTTSVAGSCSSIAMLLESAGLEFLKGTGFAFLAVDHLGEVHRFPE
jgi:FAD:protein FMN transferase